jgi:hypothetical protein
MRIAESRRAVDAAISTASGLGLAVDGGVVVNDSNRLVVRLTPCDVIARVTPLSHHWSPEPEIALACQLAATGSPIAPPDPSVEPLLMSVTVSSSRSGSTSK